MFISELFYGAQKNEETKPQVVEANQAQLVVLSPGRFQPFHLGHNEVFQTLQSKFGRDNVYIATSNKTDAAKSPFNFTDKVMLMNAAGVPSDRILEVASPYKLPAQFSPENTIFVVAVGAPDAARLAPDTTKKDGNPGYFKTFKSMAECETADKHGYCIIAAERHKAITLNGQQVDVSHGTPSRAAWNMVRNDEKGRAEYMTQMFGRADVELGRVLDKIPAAVGESLEEGAPIVVMPMAGNFPGQKKREPTTYRPQILGSYKRGVEDATAGKPYSNPYPFKRELGAPGNYDHNSYREGYQSVKGLEEGIFDRFKRKPEKPDDPQMMRAFNAAGGYDRDIDVMAWQIGWKTCAADPTADPKEVFQKMYYGGGSSFPFDQKSFMMAFNACAKMHSPKIQETTGTTMKSKEVTEATSAAVRLAKAVQRTQGKTAASQARSVIPSSIPKKEEPKKQATEGDTLYDAKETAINEESPLSQVGFSDEFINHVYRTYKIKHTELPEPMTKKPTVKDLESFVFLSKTNTGKAFAVGKGDNGWSGPGLGVILIDDGTDIKRLAIPASKAIAQVAKGEYYAIPYAANGWDGRMRGQGSTKYKRANPRDGRQVDPQDASYAYMQQIDNIYGDKIRGEMNRVVDFVYANMRKFGKERNSNISGTAPQERVLKIANTLEAAAKDPNLFSSRSGSWDRPSYMDQYLNSLSQLSHGFASVPTNYNRFKEVMDETPAGLARLAKFILGTVHAYEETVKELLYKDTVDALKQQ